MKVKDVIRELQNYNQEAEMSVIVNFKKYNFGLSFGSNEGVTRETANDVNFYVNELNGDDEILKNQ